MKSTSNQTAFPFLPMLVWLTALATVFAAVSVTITLAVSENTGASRAVIYAAVATWLAMLIGAAPLACVAHRGPSSTVAAYVVGTALRMAICFGAAFVGVMRMGLALNPMLYAMAGMYLPLLLPELVFVGRYLTAMNRLEMPDKQMGEAV